MHYNEDAFMERLDKLDNSNHRKRFLRRMEHKLHAKEQYSRSNPY